MSGTPTSRSIRSAPTERGIAYGTRVPRRRSLRSSPRAGEPSTWRRETGGPTTRTFRYARCETPYVSRSNVADEGCAGIYRQLYTVTHLRAYGASLQRRCDDCSNAGDRAMSLEKSVRSSAYLPRTLSLDSIRRTYIPKNGKMRPLGFRPSDKTAARRSALPRRITSRVQPALYGFNQTRLSHRPGGSPSIGESNGMSGDLVQC